MLKSPIDRSKALKMSKQTTNGTSTDAAMKCPRNRTSRGTIDQEPRCVMEDSISEVKKKLSQRYDITTRRKG